jgi:ribulose-5-phosphate 4-epimerase/fuculose-1-phosphate aldolase
MDAALFLSLVLARKYLLPRRSPDQQLRSPEAKRRHDLAVAHAVCHEHGMDELVWNHISARTGPNSWLITPGTRNWDEITPGDIVESSDNVTADIIHASCYEARPDVHAIVHLHTKNAVAVGCLKEGFEAVTQDGAFFHKRVAEHAWEGVSDDLREGPRIAMNLLKTKNANVLMMPNHGYCVLGATVAEAWVLAYYFEKACESLILALAAAGGDRERLNRPDPSVMEKAARQAYDEKFSPGVCEWAAIERTVKKKYGF